MRNLRLVHSSTRLEQSGTVVHPTEEPDIQPLDPNVRTLLEHVRIVPPLPRGVRARVLARARAAIAAATFPSPAKTPARRRARTIC